jgi:hypothetical protein
VNLWEWTAYFAVVLALVMLVLGPGMYVADYAHGVVKGWRTPEAVSCEACNDFVCITSWGSGGGGN